MVDEAAPNGHSVGGPETFEVDWRFRINDLLNGIMSVNVVHEPLWQPVRGHG